MCQDTSVYIFGEAVLYCDTQLDQAEISLFILPAHGLLPETEVKVDISVARLPPCVNDISPP